MNSDNKTQLRRYTINLACSGGGYIMMGMWSVVKVLLTITMNKPFFDDIMSGVDTTTMDADEEKLFHIFLIFFFIIISAIAFIVHFYIGNSAIKYSRGQKKTKFFLFAGGAMMVLTLSGIPQYFTRYDELIKKYNDSVVASTMVDLTTCFILADIINSALKIDKLRKEGEQE